MKNPNKPEILNPSGKFHKLIDSRLLDYQPVTHPGLIEYLSDRGIPRRIWQACPHLRQINYSTTHPDGSKQLYYNLIFTNEKSGGYIHATSSCRVVTVSPQTFTVIYGNREQPEEMPALVFYNWLDYLSYCTIYQQHEDAFILNANKNLSAVMQYLGAYRGSIDCYLPNTPTGFSLFERISAKYPQAVNRSQQKYPHFQTFNDWLIINRNVNGDVSLQGDNSPN